jgi:hypothetical protein
MKNLIIKYLSPYLSCFMDTPADQSNNLPPLLQVKDNLSEIITVQPLSPLSSMYPFPTLEYLPKAGEEMATRDLFLVNKPDIFNKLLNNFINYHGSLSDKVKMLRLPETSLFDRDTNIHIITGSCPHGDRLILNNLRHKESLMSMSDNISVISDSSTPSSITVPTTITGVDITSLHDIINYGATAFGG